MSNQQMIAMAAGAALLLYANRDKLSGLVKGIIPAKKPAETPKLNPDGLSRDQLKRNVMAMRMVAPRFPTEEATAWLKECDDFTELISACFDTHDHKPPEPK
jgi:hypothetical protein